MWKPRLPGFWPMPKKASKVIITLWSCHGQEMDYIPILGQGLLLTFTIFSHHSFKCTDPPPESGAVSLWTSEFMRESSQEMDYIPILGQGHQSFFIGLYIPIIRSPMAWDGWLWIIPLDHDCLSCTFHSILIRSSFNDHQHHHFRGLLLGKVNLRCILRCLAFAIVISESFARILCPNRWTFSRVSAGTWDGVDRNTIWLFVT